jgi:hypothetical protein
MSRKPSDATVVRRLRADLNRAESDKNTLNANCLQWRARATKAEQEAAEWRKRFDALLERTPKLTP